MRLERLYRALRSRGLAVLLVVGITSYAAAMTVLKISRPYANVIFITGVLWLTLSTAACAWERTRGAARRWSRHRMQPGAQPVSGTSFSLEARPAIAGDVLSHVVSSCAGHGLRVKSSERAVVASGNRRGVWGSPLFHWSLVALFVLAGLGQLTRAEGLLDIVAGGSVRDEASSYAAGSPVGPLFFDRFTGVRIGVERIAPSFRSQQVEQGDTPLVTISDQGRVVRRSYVYPNNPLTYGSLTLHRDESGLAVQTTLLFPNGQRTPATVFLRPGVTSGRGTGTLTVTEAATGNSYAVAFVPSGGRRVSVRTDAPPFSSTPLAPGEKATLPDGTGIRIDELTAYQRLRVVNDWTLPFIFGSFAFAVLGLSLSVFWPPRLVEASIAPDGSRVDVRITTARMDPAFRSLLEREMRAHSSGVEGEEAR